MLTPEQVWSVAPRPPRRWQREALPVILSAIKSRRRGLVYAATGAGKSDAQGATLRALDPAPGFVDVVVVPTQDLVEQMASDLRRWGLDVGRFYGRRKEVERVTVSCLPSVRRLAEEIEDADLRVRLVMVDEAHRVGAGGTVGAIAALQPARALGWSATPIRTKDSSVLRELWPDGILYGYAIVDAIADGAVVPPLVRWNHDENDTDVNAVTLRLLREHAVGPTVVNATDVADAEWFAAWLTEQGHPAEAIHGSMGKTRRLALLDDLRTGRLQVLVHVKLLTEGVDLPWLGTLIMRCPTGSVIRYVQEMGRVLRTYPGKESGVVIDVHNMWDRFGLPRFSDGQWADALDEAEQKAATEAAEEDLDEDEKETMQRQAAVVRDLESWIADVRRKLISAGVIESTQRGAGWRHEDATAKQREWLGKWAAKKDSPGRWLPEEWRDKFNEAVAHVDRLSKGGAADVLDVGFGVKRAAGARYKASGRWDWRLPPGIEI